MPLNLYPGIAAPIVSATPGAAVPGTIVSTGPTDTLGSFSGAMEAQGGDKRSASSLMSIGEANRDAINWCALHAVDWARGGNWSTWTGTVTLGCTLSIKVLSVGAPGTGVNAITVTGSPNSAGISVSAPSGNFVAIAAAGHGSGDGIDATGGATGNAVTATGGVTSGAALYASTGTGAASATNPVIVSHMGPVNLDTDIADTANPGGGNLWRTNVCVAWANIQITAGSATLVDGFNIASVAIGAGRNAVANKGLIVVFAQHLVNQGSNNNAFSTTYGVQPNATGVVPTAFTVGQSYVEVIVGLQSGSADVDLTTLTTVTVTLQVFGRI